MKTCTTDRSDSPVLKGNRLDWSICCAVAAVDAAAERRTVAGRADEVLLADAAGIEPTPLLSPKGRPILDAHCCSIRAILDCLSAPGAQSSAAAAVVGGRMLIGPVWVKRYSPWPSPTTCCCCCQQIGSEVSGLASDYRS